MSDALDGAPGPWDVDESFDEPFDQDAEPARRPAPGSADGPERPGPADFPPPPPAAQALAAMASKLDELVAASAREHERAAFRESVIDRLHAENQELRRGEADALLEPVRAGIVAIFDLARRAAGQLRKADDIDPERGAALLDAVADEAAEALERAGVTRIDPVVGEPVDAVRHRPVGTRPAEHPWQDGTVAEVNTPGFAAAERLIRRAEVVVARYAPQSEDPR